MTLDDDVAQALRKLSYERRQPFKQVVNDTLRQGLAPQHPVEEPFKQTSFHMGVPAGVDLTKLGQLADALEDEELVRKLREGR